MIDGFVARPYPEGAERETIGKMFDAFLSEIKTRETDKGVAMYRRVLKREMKKVQAGQDPMGLLRDPSRNTCIALPTEKKKHHNSDGLAAFMLRTHAKYAPIAAQLVQIYEGPR
jgi:hypothetical protein